MGADFWGRKPLLILLQRTEGKNDKESEKGRGRERSRVKGKVREEGKVWAGQQLSAFGKSSRKEH